MVEVTCARNLTGGCAMTLPPLRGLSSTKASTSSPTAAAVAFTATSAMTSVGSDYAAGNEREIAAHFPVPSAEVADRLVDLLLPREGTQPKGQDAA